MCVQLWASFDATNIVFDLFCLLDDMKVINMGKNKGLEAMVVIQ